MRDDGWWWNDPALTNKAIKRTVLKEMIMHRLFSPRGRRKQ
jgi:glutamate-1-semialdehyde 2,1-aminomutase